MRASEYFHFDAPARRVVRNSLPPPPLPPARRRAVHYWSGFTLTPSSSKIEKV